MTQTLFDSIQLERLKAWEELESAALDTFLKYPEFALNYSSRLESALITSNTISSDDAEENDVIIFCFFFVYTDANLEPSALRDLLVKTIH